MKMKPPPPRRRLPKLMAALAILLSVKAYAWSHQQEPATAPLPFGVVRPVAFQGEALALPEPTSVGSSMVGVETVPATPDPASFLQSIQESAGQRAADLTARRDQLRAELEQVEQELSQWEAITAAIATVPEHYRSREGDLERAAMRPPTPSVSSPFELDVAPSAPSAFPTPSPDTALPPSANNPFEPPVASPTPSPFGSPST